MQLCWPTTVVTQGIETDQFMDQLPCVSVTFVNTLVKNELMQMGLMISNLDFWLFILCPDCGSSCCLIIHIIQFVEIRFTRKNKSGQLLFSLSIYMSVEENYDLTVFMYGKLSLRS